jgi:hypothetical protein
MIRMFTGGVLKGYYAPGLPTLLGDTNVLTQLMKRTDPKYHEHLSNMGFDLTLVCPQWFIASFITSTRMEWTARIWDLVLFSNAAKGGGGGAMVWLGMCIMNAVRGKIMETDSMCRAITLIRRFTITGIEDVNADLFGKAGLSVHSFLDGRKLRADIAKMEGDAGTGGGTKRGRSEDVGGGAKTTTMTTMNSRSGSMAFQTPMTKRRKSALQSFAQRKGISKDQVEGLFLFNPAKDVREEAEGGRGAGGGAGGEAKVASCLMLMYGKRSDPQEDYMARSPPNNIMYNKLTPPIRRFAHRRTSSR